MSDLADKEEMLETSAAVCARHPTQPALVTCDRCGRFACAACRVYEAAGELCVDCEAVDPLQVRRQTFSVGRALSGGRRLFLAQPAIILLAVTVVGALCFAWDVAMQRVMPKELRGVDYWFDSVCNGTVGLLANLFVLHLVIERAEGRDTSSAECLRRSMGLFVEAFVLRFRAGFFIGLWSLLFIVPGIMKTMEWSLMLPVLVKRDGGDELDRSSELTRGNQWGIFWLSLIVALFYGVAAALAGVAAGFGAPLLHLHARVPVAVGQALVNEAYVLADLLVTLAAYYALRHEQELADAIDVPPSAPAPVIEAIPA